MAPTVSLDDSLSFHDDDDDDDDDAREAQPSRNTFTVAFRDSFSRGILVARTSRSNDLERDPSLDRETQIAMETKPTSCCCCFCCCASRRVKSDRKASETETSETRLSRLVSFISLSKLTLGILYRACNARRLIHPRNQRWRSVSTAISTFFLVRLLAQASFVPFRDRYLRVRFKHDCVSPLRCFYSSINRMIYTTTQFVILYIPNAETQILGSSRHKDTCLRCRARYVEIARDCHDSSGNNVPIKWSKLPNNSIEPRLSRRAYSRL